MTTLPAPPEPTGVSSESRIDPDANSLHDSQHSHSDPFSKSLEFDPESLLPSPAAGPNPAEQDDFGLSRSPTNETVRSIRHVRPSPGGSLRKHTLVPLQLGPVVLRDVPDATRNDPLPSTTLGHSNSKRQHHRSESTQELLHNPSHQSYFTHRETPYQRCGRQSTEALTSRRTNQETFAQPHNEPSLMATKATASTPSLSSSLRHHVREASSSSSLLTLNERPRTGNRLQRKRPNQSKSSFGNPGDSDIEKEVLELNTIVEERRAEGNKGRHRDSRHVPAVAPSMQIGVRSETLNDIGSALSRPLTAPYNNSQNTAKEPGSSQIQPEDSRVPRWLSTVSTSTQSGTAASNDSNDDSFYKCEDTDALRQNHSNLSTNSSATALDSVLYTLESSPTTSKRYSRSLMITPLTPVDDDIVAGNDARRVGIAL